MRSLISSALKFRRGERLNVSANLGDLEVALSTKKLPNLTLQEEKLIVFSGCQTT